MLSLRSKHRDLPRMIARLLLVFERRIFFTIHTYEADWLAIIERRKHGQACPDDDEGLPSTNASPGVETLTPSQRAVHQRNAVPPSRGSQPGDALGSTNFGHHNDRRPAAVDRFFTRLQDRGGPRRRRSNGQQRIMLTTFDCDGETVPPR